MNKASTVLSWGISLTEWSETFWHWFERPDKNKQHSMRAALRPSLMVWLDTIFHQGNFLPTYEILTQGRGGRQWSGASFWMTFLLEEKKNVVWASHSAALSSSTYSVYLIAGNKQQQYPWKLGVKGQNVKRNISSSGPEWDFRFSPLHHFFICPLSAKSYKNAQKHKKGRKKVC